MTIIPRGKGWRTNLHYWASALLLLGLVPCLRRLNLSLNFSWAVLLFVQWLVLAVLSIFVAALLYFVGFATKETLAPVVQRFQRDKRRIVLVLAYFLSLCWASGWFKALVLTVDTVAIIELLGGLKSSGVRRVTTAVLVPGLYLFLGLLLVSAYNQIIVSVRFFAATDVAFNTADKWLLHGWSVSQLSHWAIQRLPFSFFRLLEFVYFGMFPQVGSALILTSLNSGKRCGLQFVGAILTAYYVSLVVFYIWPSHGPYYLCPTHFSDFPRQLASYALQQRYLHDAQALWAHVRLSQISFDYFIAFPCMHITQPLIGLWFLRRWKRIVAVLVAYDLILVVAVVLLEWHYVIDVIAGILLAFLAIATVDGHELWRSIAGRGNTTAECPVTVT
jgi:hypothetical protein